MHYKGPSIGMIVCACLCGAASSSADVITDWNARTAQAVGAATGAAARLAGTGLLDFAMVHAAMHDAIQAFEHRFETYGPPIEGATGSSVAAAAAAAHDVLVVLFPPQVGSIDSFYTTYLASQGLTGDPGVAVGQAAAANILALRQDDGRFPATFDPVLGGTDPGQWRPVRAQSDQAAVSTVSRQCRVSDCTHRGSLHSCGLSWLQCGMAPRLARDRNIAQQHRSRTQHMATSRE